jgi:hypothetical protein
MTDITPSPAADGPFILAIDEVRARAAKLGQTNPRLAELVAQGKSFIEIGQILHDEELAAHAAGASPNV